MSDSGKPTTILAVSRDEARQKLQARIKRGQEIRDTTINTQGDLNNARKEEQKWTTYNKMMLQTLYSNSIFFDQYYPQVDAFIAHFAGSLYYEIDDFRVDIDKYITRLEAILEQLELIPEESTSNPHLLSSVDNSLKQVFIVHGHDETARESVARFVEKLDLSAVILQERPSKGRTLIEKFEQEAANIGFAIVLMTPDDIGSANDSNSDMQTRARQNVIFELGYFVGRLGRGNVCMLSKGHIELPSDFLGVVYVSLDSSDWKSELAREMKSAQLVFDFNKAL